MMKRMAYKDETSYHLHMDLDDSPVKRLFELEEEAARRGNALALVEMQMVGENYILTKMDGNSGDLVDLVLTGLARLLNEVRIPEATDRSLSESVYNDLIELLAKERSNVLH